MKYDLEGICQDCMYLEKVKPLFEEKDKEIDRLKGALQTHEILLKTNVEEIDRLNNIINELNELLMETSNENAKLNVVINKYIIGIEDMWVDNAGEDTWIYNGKDFLSRQEFLDKLKELKEDNK